MEYNEELRRAWEFAEHTHTSIFLTGKAGTGKTTFLRTLRRNSAKSIVVVAPTGVAAINAGGVTIHSFFQLPLSPYIPGAAVRDKFSFSKEKLRIIRMLDLLVIDEISMVRSDLLDAVDNALRKYRRNTSPFGGVQLLMIGDLQQLSPIITPQDEELLAGHYPTPYFFGSRALQQLDYVTIELTKVYRQQNMEFIELLNHVRSGNIGPRDLRLLNSRYIPDFVPDEKSSYIRLTTHNILADQYNEQRLNALPDRSSTYRAQIKGTFPDSSFPTTPELRLKRGAQVMFVRNDTSAEHLYYNGKIGHVVDMDDDTVRVVCDGDDHPIEVKATEWENARYRVNDTTGELEAEVLGTFSQFPLRLAWSITIHKSQGLTFEHAVIDAGSSFAPGQVYVALSRCKSLEGIVLATAVGPDAILTDEQVTEYVTRQSDEAQRSIGRLPAIKLEYYRMLAIELFSFGEIFQCEMRLSRIISENCRRTYPTIVAQHSELLTEMRSRIIEVADKWLPVLRRMTDDELHSPTTAERIKRGARYFYDTLLNLFEPIFNRITDIAFTNKAVATRFKEIVTDLYQTVRGRMLLLDKIAIEGYSVANYLNNKQRAIAESTKDPAKKGKKERTRRQKTLSTKAVKEEKIPSWYETYRMFSDGLVPETIADRRGLTLSTIWNHLGSAVGAGKIGIHDLLDDEVIERITKAYRSIEEAVTLNDIRQRLGNKVGYNEIKLVLRYLRSESLL